MEKDNTLLWVVLIGGGAYLWWKSKNAASTPGVLVTNTATPLVIVTTPVTVSTAQPVSMPAAPIVVDTPQPVYNQASVNQNAALPVSTNGPVPPLTPPVTVLQPPLAPFPIGTNIVQTYPVNQSLVVPSANNNALYLKFENGDYPQGTVNMATLHATGQMD